MDVDVTTQDAWTTQFGISFGNNGASRLTPSPSKRRTLLGTGRSARVSYGKDAEERINRLIEFRTLTSWARTGTAISCTRRTPTARKKRSGSGALLLLPEPLGHGLPADASFPARADLGERRGSVDLPADPPRVPHHLRARVDRERRARLAVVGRVRAARGRVQPPAGQTGGPASGRPQLPLSDGPLHEDISNNFIKLNYVNRDSRFEDFNLGSRLLRDVRGFSAAFGLDRTTEFLRVDGSRGWRISPLSFLTAQLGFETRLDAGVHNAILSANLNFVRKFRHAAPADARLEPPVRPGLEPRSRRAVLCADGGNGLRGYRLHSFEGNKRIIWNLEHRLFTGREVLQLRVARRGRLLRHRNRHAGGSAAEDLGIQDRHRRRPADRDFPRLDEQRHPRRRRVRVEPRPSAGAAGSSPSRADSPSNVAQRQPGICPFGAPACGSAGCGLDRRPDPGQPLRLARASSFGYFRRLRAPRA